MYTKILQVAAAAMASQIHQDDRIEVIASCAIVADGFGFVTLAQRLDTLINHMYNG